MAVQPSLALHEARRNTISAADLLRTTGFSMGLPFRSHMLDGAARPVPIPFRI